MQDDLSESEKDAFIRRAATDNHNRAVNELSNPEVKFLDLFILCDDDDFAKVSGFIRSDFCSPFEDNDYTFYPDVHINNDKFKTGVRCKVKKISEIHHLAIPSHIVFAKNYSQYTQHEQHVVFDAAQTIEVFKKSTDRLRGRENYKNIVLMDEDETLTKITVKNYLEDYDQGLSPMKPGRVIPTIKQHNIIMITRDRLQQALRNIADEIIYNQFIEKVINFSRAKYDEDALLNLQSEITKIRFYGSICQYYKPIIEKINNLLTLKQQQQDDQWTEKDKYIQEFILENLKTNSQELERFQVNYPMAKSVNITKILLQRINKKEFLEKQIDEIILPSDIIISSDPEPVNLDPLVTKVNELNQAINNRYSEKLPNITAMLKKIPLENLTNADPYYPIYEKMADMAEVLIKEIDEAAQHNQNPQDLVRDANKMAKNASHYYDVMTTKKDDFKQHPEKAKKETKTFLEHCTKTTLKEKFIPFAVAFSASVLCYAIGFGVGTIIGIFTGIVHIPVTATALGLTLAGLGSATTYKATDKLIKHNVGHFQASQPYLDKAKDFAETVKTAINPQA